MPSSTTSSPSSSARRWSDSRCSTRRYTSPTAFCRTVAMRSISEITPGRTIFAACRYSHPSRNSTLGASCSIARPSRNSSKSFRPAQPAPRQPNRAATVRRCSVRVCLRAPYPARSAIGTPSCTATRVRRRRRHRGDVVRHETQPRQRAQLDRHPEPVARPARRALQPRPIIRAEREIPDQLIATQLLRPRPQPPDLRIGEEARAHPDTARPKRSPTSYILTNVCHRLTPGPHAAPRRSTDRQGSDQRLHD
jgi:hypothetical protein